MASRVLRLLIRPLGRPSPALRQPSLRPQHLQHNFHTSRPFLVKVGDSIPNLEVLVEDSPGNKVSLANELQNVKTGIIVGVPAAFSPACSKTHVPSYINNAKVQEMLKDGSGKVFVVSVNDPFVMKAWHDQLDPVRESGIRFLGDPTGAFTQALEVGFDGSAIFGGMRSKRYALVVEDGKVTAVHVEPDNTGVNVSVADKVLG